MITGQGLTYQVDEKKTESCEDFSFPGGVSYIPYAKKDVFSALSLSSVPFASGSLSVDDIQLAPGVSSRRAGPLPPNRVPLTHPPAREPGGVFR